MLKAAPGVRVVGEDLGCVPDYVRPDLSYLRIAGFKIPHWEIDDHQQIVNGATYNPCSFATYATHDFPPLCNDWNEWNDAVVEAMGALSDPALPAEQRTRLQQRGRDCARVLCWLGDFAGVPHHRCMEAWNPDIKTALIRALLQCRSAYAALMWTELFDIPVRLNTPGTEGGTNWRPRIPFTAEQAAAMEQSAWLRDLSAEAQRV